MNPRIGVLLVLIVAVLMVVAGACAREDDGRDVVMVEPTEGTSGEEATGLSERPQSHTLGGATSPDALTPYEQDAAEASDELMTQGQYLDRLLAADSCTNVEELRDRICDLAARICEIADSHPESQRTRVQCDDATARCTDAAQRVAEQCAF